MSSVLDSLDLESIPDQSIVAADEYELQVLKCELEHNERTGNWNIAWIFKILGKPDALNVFHYTSVPIQGVDDVDKFNNKGRFMKEIFKAFNMTKSDVGTEAVIGRTCWAVLGIDEYEGREKNTVKRWIIPK